jgi:hypothetical protein
VPANRVSKPLPRQLPYPLNASAAGLYGLNTAAAGGDPSSTSYGFGYLCHQRVENSINGALGVILFRGDNAGLGKTVDNTTMGMFFVF